MLSHPATARRGNLIAAGGMLLAVLGTIFLYHDEAGNALHNYWWIFGGILIGAVVGVLAAKKVKMTAMPEMVSLFNGMGGACAMLISIVEFNHLMHAVPEKWTIYPPLSALGKSGAPFHIPIGELLIIVLGLIIGTISFTGSIIAWGKLNGRIKDFSFRGQHIFNILLLLIIVGLSVWLVYSSAEPVRFLLTVIFYSILHFLLSTEYFSFCQSVERICLL